MTAIQTKAVVFAIETRIIPTGAAGDPDNNRRPKRGGCLRFLIWAALLFIFAFAFYLVLGRKEAPKTRMIPPVTLTTGTAAKGNIGVYIDAIGTVTPVHTASIFSQVTGPVVAVDYQEGQSVTQGTLLVEIDPRPFAATLMQAEGTLERDENVLAQARMDLQRYQDAWARNAIAKQTLDDQDKVVKQDEGTVKNDQGTVEYDRLQVEYCHITAPFNGQVGLRLIDPGNLINAGSGGSSATPLVVITQLQPITVIFTIPEDSLGPVQAQLRKNAKLTVDAYDRSEQTKLATGELVALDNQIDTTTGTLKLRSVFNNDNLALYPNQFVNTRLLVQMLEGVTLIPSECIQQNGQTSFVYVIQDGVAHVREVQPGVSDSGKTQVSGLEPGEVIADSSFDKLQEGAKVMVAGASGGSWNHGARGGSSSDADHSPNVGHSPHPGHSPHAHHSPSPDQ